MWSSRRAGDYTSSASSNSGHYGYSSYSPAMPVSNWAQHSASGSHSVLPDYVGMGQDYNDNRRDEGSSQDQSVTTVRSLFTKEEEEKQTQVLAQKIKQEELMLENLKEIREQIDRAIKEEGADGYEGDSVEGDSRLAELKESYKDGLKRLKGMKLQREKETKMFKMMEAIRDLTLLENILIRHACESDNDEWTGRLMIANRVLGQRGLPACLSFLKSGETKLPFHWFRQAYRNSSQGSSSHQGQGAKYSLMRTNNNTTFANQWVATESDGQHPVGSTGYSSSSSGFFGDSRSSGNESAYVAFLGSIKSERRDTPDRGSPYSPSHSRR